jgi:hypothetical protein
MAWLPPSKLSSLSGPNPTTPYAVYAHLLKTLCLAVYTVTGSVVGK